MYRILHRPKERAGHTLPSRSYFITTFRPNLPEGKQKAASGCRLTHSGGVEPPTIIWAAPRVYCNRIGQENQCSPPKVQNCGGFFFCSSIRSRGFSFGKALIDWIECAHAPCFICRRQRSAVLPRPPTTFPSLKGPAAQKETALPMDEMGKAVFLV